MRIFHVIDSLEEGGGTQTFLLNLVRGLRDLSLERDGRAYEQRVYCVNAVKSDTLTSRLNSHGVEVKKIGRLAFVLGLGRRPLGRDLRTERPEILQTFLPASNLFGRLAAFLAGKRRGVVCSIRARNIDKNALIAWLDRRTMHLADRVVFNSASVVPYARRREGVREDQVVFIPNGIEVPERPAEPALRALREEFNLNAPSEANLVLGMTGRLYPQKAHGDLLEAFRIILHEKPETHLLLFGDGPLRISLEHRADELGVRERVRFAGRRSDVANCLHLLDIYVHSSTFEGMPNAVMEAMGAGLPIVATSVDGTTELLSKSGAGVLVPPGNPAAFAAAVLKLMSDPERRREVARPGPDYIQNELTIRKMAERYDAVYRELAEVSS